MTVQTKIVLVILGGLLLGCIVIGAQMVRRGFSARDEPSSLEAFIADRMRRLATPRAAREMQNPIPLTPEVLAEGRAHFADHCATCHGNDGRGHTEMGRKLYPKAPDMQLEGTQSLTDGEIYHIIRNGVRLTGMPAWGPDPPAEDLDSWKLVHFIRHLPDVTTEELTEMKSMNPMSRRQFEEEQEIKRFLEGGEPASPPPQHVH